MWLRRTNYNYSGLLLKGELKKTTNLFLSCTNVKNQNKKNKDKSEIKQTRTADT